MSQISNLKGEEFVKAVKALYFEVIHKLADDFKRDEYKQYRLYIDDEYMYYKDTNIQLNKLRFKASNQFELWLKIYHYFNDRNVSHFIYDEERVCDTFRDNMHNYDDYENIELFIEYEISCFNEKTQYPDMLRWELEDYEII